MALEPEEKGLGITTPTSTSIEMVEGLILEKSFVAGERLGEA